MSTPPSLTPATPQPGVPLYLTVKQHLSRIILAGAFQPGDRLPSTKEMSEALEVSLVTMHRALQELEASGVVDRQQGRGTFVTDPRSRSTQALRVGLVLQPEASIADFYHSEVIEGIRRGARETETDLTMIQGPEQHKPVCRSYLLLNPTDDQLQDFIEKTEPDAPLLILGAQHEQWPWIDVDNVAMIAKATQHAYQLGHRKLAFIGGADELSNSRDRRRGYLSAAQELGLPESGRVLLSARSWRLESNERMALNSLLAKPDRPTAVIAGGYHLALDVYQVARTLGLRIPEDLSVIGVDDPPSAGHLSPPLTTVRQPLIQLGYAAMTTIARQLSRDQTQLKQLMQADLVIRQSSASINR